MIEMGKMILRRTRKKETISIIDNDLKDYRETKRLIYFSDSGSLKNFAFACCFGFDMKEKIPLKKVVYIFTKEGLEREIKRRIKENGKKRK